MKWAKEDDFVIRTLREERMTAMTPIKPNDVLEWSDGQSEPHRWRVRGIHLGGIGIESVIELENVSHKPGWTGEWETHQLMFVPECLLRNCQVVR